MKFFVEKTVSDKMDSGKKRLRKLLKPHPWPQQITRFDGTLFVFSKRQDKRDVSLQC